MRQIFFAILSAICLAWPTGCVSWGKFWDNPEILSFAIPARGLTGVIKDNRISLIDETYSTLTSEKATFTTSGGKVTINGVLQTSGVTANNFDSTLTYRVTGESGSIRDYTVTLFAPRLVTGLAAWYRADSLSLTDGTNIILWPDSSGNGNDLNSSHGGSLPIFYRSRINSKPVAEFTYGTGDDGIFRNSASGFSGSSFATFIVLRHNSSNLQEQYIYVIDDSGTCSGLGLTQTLRITTWQTDVAQPCVGYYETGAPAISDTTKFHSIVTTYNAATPRLGLYQDGALVVSSAPVIALPTINYISLGNYGTGANKSLDGELAEILIYTTALSEINRVKISCYLSNKYALATAESCP